MRIPLTLQKVAFGAALRKFFVPCLLLTFVTILRIPAFFQSAIDVDESVYLLVSRSILEGNVPYTEVWDHKPPGIYVLFAIAQFVFGHSLSSIRLLTCIAVGITCYVLLCIGRLINGSIGSEVGILSGTLYAVYSLENTGLAANTEIFFNLFVAVSFYLIISEVRRSRSVSRGRTLAAGLVMGMALQIKYVVIFEFALIFSALLILDRLVRADQTSSREYSFISLYNASLVIIGLLLSLILNVEYYTFLFLLFLSTFLLISDVFGKGEDSISKRKNTLLGIRNAILFTAGATFPFLLTLLFFALQGHLAEYLHANFVANSTYTAQSSFSLGAIAEAVSQQLENNLLLWLCAIVFPYYLYRVSRSLPSPQKRTLILIGFWLIVAFLGAVFTKRLWLHNFLQLLPPFCLITGWLVSSLLLEEGKSKRPRQYLAIALLLVVATFNPVISALQRGQAYIQSVINEGIQSTYDTPAKIARYIKPRLKQGDSIYVVDYEPIIYYLSQARVPTRYVLPRWVYDTAFSSFTGIDQFSELNDIFEQNPEFLIVRDLEFLRSYSQDFVQRIEQELNENYQLDKEVDAVKLYRLVAPVSA